MNDWTSGYVADIDYTYGYYQELNPERVKLSFLNAGLDAPEFGIACELGFGQGLSANIHAAASVCTWYGTDFNPAQAGFAQELATASGAAAQLFDESFEEFASRDLPEFDYIGLHGIWSWISDENRRVIVEFIRKRLKVGGVLYISYNTLPGWSAFAPMRHLMTEHAEVMGAAGVGLASRIDGALNFTEKLLETNPLFLKANPLVAAKMNQIKGQSRHYLAHEYFNKDWHPMHFAKMAEWLAPAKLTFACSAHYMDYLDAANLTTDQLAFLSEIHDPVFKQTVRDFMVNQPFRKDYWVRGAQRLNLLEVAEEKRAQRFIMTSYRPAVTLKVQGFLGEANLTESIHAPILDLMADYRIRTLGEIEDALRSKAISFEKIHQAVIVFSSSGIFSSVQIDEAISRAKNTANKLNAHLLHKARGSSEISFLASPVTGGGVPVGRFQQLFLLAMQQGKKTPEDWASYVSSILTAQGQIITVEGRPMSNLQEQVAELTTQAHEFSLKQLPILKALHIA